MNIAPNMMQKINNHKLSSKQCMISFERQRFKSQNKLVSNHFVFHITSRQKSATKCESCHRYGEKKLSLRK